MSTATATSITRDGLLTDKRADPCLTLKAKDAAERLALFREQQKGQAQAEEDFVSAATIDNLRGVAPGQSQRHSSGCKTLSVWQLTMTTSHRSSSKLSEGNRKNALPTKHVNGRRSRRFTWHLASAVSLRSAGWSIASKGTGRIHLKLNSCLRGGIAPCVGQQTEGNQRTRTSRN
jgi:hypothetical protein